MNLKEIIDAAREAGVSEVTVDHITYKIGPTPKEMPTHVFDQKPEDLVKPLSVLDEMSDEEILYWATPYYDELQARKEAAKNQKQIDDELKEKVA